MSSEDTNNNDAPLETSAGIILDTEEKLRHEVQYLNERVTNLEVFKKNFFEQHYDLIESRERISLLESQLNLDKVKSAIISSEDGVLPPPQESDLLLDYFRDCLTATSFQDLVMSLFQSSESIATDISLVIQGIDNQPDFSNDNNSREESLGLINSNRDGEEVIQLGDKTILNYKHISLIYCVQPAEDETRQKQYHDFMEIITLGANSRISHIKQVTELESLRRNIYHIFKKTNKSFNEMQNSIDENTIKVSSIFEDCRNALLTHIEKMKIDPSSVSLLKLLLDDSRSQLLIELTSSMALDSDFLTVMKRLEDAYAKEYANPG